MEGWVEGGVQGVCSEGPDDDCVKGLSRVCIRNCNTTTNVFFFPLINVYRISFTQYHVLMFMPPLVPPQ